VVYVITSIILFRESQNIKHKNVNMC